MTTNYVDNILSTLDRATDDDVTSGMYWYVSANALTWSLDHVSPVRAAGVIAALSPRLSWTKNMEYAGIAYDLKGYGITPEILSYIPTLNNSRTKALKMVNGAHPRDVLGNGPKTNAFFDNIANPYTSRRVTVDKHAFDIAMNARTGYNNVITNKMYAILENAYVEAAYVADLMPLQVQAITWVAWRNIHYRVR